jgi:hypothetical protein
MAAPSAPAPSPIGVVVRALAEIGLEGEATLSTVLRAMGWGDMVTAVPPVNVPARSRPPGPPAPQSTISRRVTDRRGGQSTLPTLVSTQSEEPEWLRDCEPLRIRRRRVPLFEKPIASLFPPLVTRAILSRLAAAPTSLGEVDVSKLVETMGRGRPFTILPRRSVLTLSKGLDVLVDYGRGMDPFRVDIVDLLDSLARAVGPHRLSIRAFRSCPSMGVMDLETAATTRYRPPSNGTPVLAVTDLGMAEQRARGGMLPETDWLDFAGQLRAGGSPLLVLMPCPPSQAPLAIRRSIKLVIWDRHTGARLTERSRSNDTLGPLSDGAARLARLASIAGRIEPQLLRALRLTLATDLGVEAEADLWLSNWVQTAAITGAVLRPEHQRQFQDELATAGANDLTRAWEILYRLRTDRPWSDRDQVGDCSWLLAQEELTYWALKGLGDEGPERVAVERRLGQILKTLIIARGSKAEGDALLWTATAPYRLPPSIMDLEPMQHLLLGAALRGADTIAPPALAEATRVGVPGYLIPRARTNMSHQRFVVDAQRHISVFISHSAENNEEARHYEALLKAAGFLAFQYGRGLQPGEHVRNVLFDQINKCHFFVFLISDHSVASEWVQRELGLALSLQQKNRFYRPVIIPLYSKTTSWRKLGIRPTKFPVRNFETGVKLGPFDLSIRVFDKYASAEADSDDVLISLMQPRLLVTRVNFHDEATFHETEVFHLYEDLFPPIERDDPEDIVQWVLWTDVGKNRSVTLPDKTALSYKLDSRYFILSLMGRAIGLASFTFDYRSNLVYGNYIAVQESWRGGDIATAFLDEIMNVLNDLFPQHLGVVFEVEKFDKNKVGAIIEYLESQERKAFLSDDDMNEVRKFVRVSWYQKTGCFFFVDKLTNEPLTCTSPCLDPSGSVVEWRRKETDYWIMWLRRSGTPLDIRLVKDLWVSAVNCIYIEILAKSLVESSPDTAQEYWRYANSIVDRTLSNSQSREISFGKFLHRHDSDLLARWGKLGMRVAI